MLKVFIVCSNTEVSCNPAGPGVEGKKQMCLKKVPEYSTLLPSRAVPQVPPLQKHSWTPTLSRRVYFHGSRPAQAPATGRSPQGLSSERVHTDGTLKKAYPVNQLLKFHLQLRFEQKELKPLWFLFMAWLRSSQIKILIIKELIAPIIASIILY